MLGLAGLFNQMYRIQYGVDTFLVHRMSCKYFWYLFSYRKITISFFEKYITL